MTFDTERATLGRQPVIICELDLDKCFEVYGVSPCTANLAAGLECHNTRATCQDPANYNNTATSTLQFSNLLVIGETFLPCIESINLAPSEINPAKGLGLRAKITIKLNDFPHHDRGIDPYIANRSYDAATQGTFFSKMIARHKHYIGRPLRVKTGYIADPFNIADFQTRNYVIDSITGPDTKGRVTIVGKDILALADDKRAQCPAPSTGLLVSNISDSATSLTVTSGTEGEYNAESDYIRINDEIILSPAGNRSSNVFSNLSRAQFGSAAASHTAEDSIQACKHLDAANCVDFAKELLEDYASLDAAYIIDADWDAERDTWFSTSTINTLITEAEGVTELLNKLAEEFYFQIWWNEIDQEVIFKTIVPPRGATSINELDEDAHLIAGKTAVIREDGARLSRVLYYFNVRNPIDYEEAADFKALNVHIRTDDESADNFGEVKQKKIMARFVDSAAIAVQTSGRLLGRFGKTPVKIQCSVDAKDANEWTGDYIDVNTRRLQDVDGSNLVTRFQITKVKELTREASGSIYEYTGLEVDFQTRYGYVGPNTLNDYDVESVDNQRDYGFIAPDTGIFTSDNAEAYRII